MDDTRERVFRNIQQKPTPPPPTPRPPTITRRRDEFCREVRMSMLIFLPVTEENLSFRGGEAHPPPPPPPPMVTGLPSKRPFCVSRLAIRHRGTSPHQADSTSGGCIDFHWGWGVGGKSEVSRIFCDCSASVSDGCLQEEQLGP